MGSRNNLFRFTWRRVVSRKQLMFGGSAVLVVFIVVFGYFVAQPVIAHFGRDQVPADCSDAVSHLPTSRNYPISGYGTGTLVAENATTAVVVAADYGGTPFVAHVSVVNKADQRVMRAFDFSNDIVNAGFDGGTLYLFNDKLGYFVDTNRGALLSNIIESDNYRGLFETNGSRFVQSDITVSAITSHWTLISRHHFHMSSVAYGCYLP